MFNYEKVLSAMSYMLYYNLHLLNECFLHFDSSNIYKIPIDNCILNRQLHTILTYQINNNMFKYYTSAYFTNFLLYVRWLMRFKFISPEN